MGFYNARNAGLTGKDGVQGAGPGFNLNDEPFQLRANVYRMVRGQVLAGTRGLDSALVRRVQLLVSRTDVALAAVSSAVSLLPQHAYNQRQPAYLQQTAAQWEQYANTVLGAKQEMVANALTGADQEAASIVSAALAAAVPSQPSFADDDDVAGARDDVRALLIAAGSGANAKASAMLADALANSDDLGIFALVGADSARVLRACGVQIDSLRRTYALAKSGVSSGQPFQPYSLNARYTPGLQFIVAQEDAGSSLAGLIAQAHTVADQGLADVRALILGGQL